ncbi:uncharacterized protein [Parasteatoda tepidariorum]|uniref:uncharacterized protein isoform X3 n=1 Tax=Parasteatoda tepidariorum TaxID=114398 RepID=UPI001C71DAA5|nr:uncharacterized protein LOC107446151 isoform X3 [Parasteatoda tepidariorum]
MVARCLIPFGIVLIGGITYGIILALRPYFHKADVVIPFQNLTNSTKNDSYIAFRIHSYDEMFEKNNLSLGILNHTVTAFPHIPGLSRGVPPQCKDPTFACQDLASARLCNAVSDCIHDVWSNIRVPEPNDEVCDICKEMVKEARDQLLSNMTQEEIKEVFEGSCKLLPIKLVADACIKVVDEIIPQLVEMLASRMDPTMVCTVSGMCFSTGTPAEHRILKIVEIILSKDKASKCAECQSLVTDAQRFLKDTPESEVANYLEKFCFQKMPSYLCDLVIKHYMPDIYTYLKATPALTVCISAGVCTKNCDLENPKVEDELTCEFCYHVLEHVKDLMTTNTTEEEFRTALLNFCKHTGSFSTKCTSFVNNYYDKLFDYIRKLDTKGMCTLIGLCGNDSCSKMTPLVKVIPAFEPRRKVPLFKLQPAQKITKEDIIPLVKLFPANVLTKKEMKETNDIFQPLLPLEKFVHPILEQDTECALCKAFSFYLETDLAGDKSKDGVRHTIGEVCGKWMVEYPDHCARITQKYSMRMQYAIAEGVSFEDLCSNVKACALNDKRNELKQIIDVKKEGPFCDLCKDAMNEVEKQLSDPATKQKLKDLLDQGCNVLPQSMRDDCTNFLNSNIDALIDILEQELQPNNICPALKLCSEPRISAPRRVKDLECDVCKSVVTSFRQKLEDPNSKKIILTFLEEGCIRLPSSLAAECKKFVDEEIDTIISIIVQEMDPDSVCGILKICPESLVKRVMNPIKDVECELCKEVVSKVEDMVKDKKTEDEIKAALDKVCSYLPSSIASRCETFVNQYTDILIELLTQELDPQMVCAELKVCPSSIRIEKPKRLKSLECDLCKEAVTEVENLVKDEKTEEEIKAALEKMCSVLPSKIAAKCQSFVDKYTALVITLLSQELDPTMVCAALNVCPVQDIECESCKEALHYLQNELMDPETQSELKNVVKKVCSILPGKLETNCGAFIDEYGSSLLTLIAQEIDPSVLCVKAQLCSNTSAHFEKNVELNKFGLDECSVCTTVVDYLDKLLEEDDVDKEITQVVEKVCTVLPSSFKDKCATMLETYGPYLLQMIGQLADSKQVCQDIDLCARSPTSVHLIGGSKCTFGPSYWCKSSAHAAACKAETYCKNQALKN